MDLIVIGYLILPIVLTIYIPIIGWPSKYYQTFIKSYVLFIIIFISIFCGINLEWFNEFGNHINAMIILYGTSGETEVWKLIWEEYNIILYVLLWIIIIYSFHSLFLQLIKKKITKNNLISKIFYLIFSLILSVLFMRGGFQEKPVDWGYAHFSKNNMANQLAQNTVFFLGKSIIQYYQEEKFSTKYVINDIKKLNQICHDNRKKNNGKKLNVQLKNIPGKSPNIILIVLESFISENCNFLNPNLTEEITPNLNKIAEQGISFKRCFANGIRSAYGISSILCSWPVLPGRPIISQVEASFNNNKAGGPIRLMTKLGYTQIFLYGGNANFDNMKGFVMANGFNDVIDWSDGFLQNNETGTMWGLFDHIMFDNLIETAENSSKQNNPFMITFFTTTNHDPFRVPEKYKSKLPNLNLGNRKYQRAKLTMAYDDLLIAEFLNKAKKYEWYDNTIFIFTADHGLTVHRDMSNHPLNGHIPFIIYSELLDTNMIIDKIVSQIDVFPTILDLLEQNNELNTLYGISGLRTGPGFASRVTDKQLQCIDSSYVYNEFINTEKWDIYQYDNHWGPYINLSKEISSAIINKNREICRSYIQDAYRKYKNIY